MIRRAEYIPANPKYKARPKDIGEGYRLCTPDELVTARNLRFGKNGAAVDRQHPIHRSMSWWNGRFWRDCYIDGEATCWYEERFYYRIEEKDEWSQVIESEIGGKE